MPTSPQQADMSSDPTNVARETSSDENSGPRSAPVVQEFVGYTTSTWSFTVYILLTAFSGGLIWIFGHFFPQVLTWTLHKSPLRQAQYVQAKLINGRCELVKVKEHHELQTQTSETIDRHDIGVRLQRVITVLLVVYVYDASADSFQALLDMPHDLPLQIHNARQALQLIDQGADWSIFNTAGTWPRRARARLYGSNDMATGRPSLLSMACGLLMYPVYVAQYLELGFNFYENYIPYAAILLFITVASGFFATFRLHEKQMILYNSVRRRQVVPLVMFGFVRAVQSHRLVPGDVLVLLRGKATCDMVLLRGNCLVEESMLSGEAAQVRKSGFVPEGGVMKTNGYHPDTHHTCTVHAGTFVQQVWNESNAEDEVLVMVVRTGLCTTMGNMLRQVTNPLHNTQLYKDPFLRDLFSFCALALVLHIGIFILYITRARTYYHGPSDVVKRVVNIFLGAFPTGLATVLIFSLGTCAQKLARQKIHVLQPEKIKTIADVSVVCFDKTGTLTGSVPEFQGMLPVEEGEFTTLQRSAFRWPDRLKQAAAVCNALSFVSRKQAVGDVCEREVFKAVEAQFLERNLVALPLNRGHRMVDQVLTLQILRRFEFEASLMRSGVVAVDTDNPDTGLLFVRGAPSTVEQLIRGGQIPADFRQVVDNYSGQSYRLLALAGGVVQGVGKLNLAAMSQQQLEARAGSLDLLGLFVLSNHLRHDSRECITHLQDRGAIRTMMVTGDYHHTAIAVARGAGMIPGDSRVVIIQSQTEIRPSCRHPACMHSALKCSKSAANNPLTPKRAVSFHISKANEQERTCEGLKFLLDNGDAFEDGDALSALTSIAQGQAQCCVTGPAFQHMLQQDDLSVVETVMRNVVVFARMKSHQKGQVMDLLGERGLHQIFKGQPRHVPGLCKTCMYCGDGINDLTALGAADVGMAVGSSEASAAATLADRKSSIAGVAVVIREARAAQVIKLALVKYMVVYQILLHLAMNMTFYLDGSSFSNVQD
ncbi:TPA: hypothetical protein ACH3X3_002538 [Trebouxia sp. C0006]